MEEDGEKIEFFDSKTDGFIYLLQEREFIRLNEPVYKLGKTKQTQLKRFASYPKGSSLLIHLQCFDCDTAERVLIEQFNTLFIRKKEYGSEYYEGDKELMIRTITNYIYPHDNGVKKEEKKEIHPIQEKVFRPIIGDIGVYIHTDKEKQSPITKGFLKIDRAFKKIGKKFT